MSYRIRILHTLPDTTVHPGAAAPVVEVFTYTDTTSATIDAALHHAHILTIPGGPPSTEPTDPHALAYRARGNRPLGNGDIVSVNDTHYACTPTQWTPVDAPRLVPLVRHGTTPASLARPIPLTDGQARRIAADWHSGQWSAVYALCSSGAIVHGVHTEITAALLSLEPGIDGLELLALADYSAAGHRPPVPGWSELWDPAPVLSR